MIGRLLKTHSFYLFDNGWMEYFESIPVTKNSIVDIKDRTFGGLYEAFYYYNNKTYKRLLHPVEFKTIKIKLK